MNLFFICTVYISDQSLSEWRINMHKISVFIKCSVFFPQVYQSSRPLRIGYLENDGYSQPSPSFVRGLREVRALLEQAGHTVRQQQPNLDMRLWTFDCIPYLIPTL